MNALASGYVYGNWGEGFTVFQNEYGIVVEVKNRPSFKAITGNAIKELFSRIKKFHIQ